jgi:Dolichyl-phosphate-mannose-protein mannosyltransferase
VSISDSSFYEVECVVATILIVGFALAWLVRSLAASRPGFAMAAPIGIALLVRVLAAGGVSQLSVAGTLRGGDEGIFTDLARDISREPMGSASWLDPLTEGLDLGGLHEIVFAAQYRLLDSPEFALRVTQAGIAVTGLLLLACAVYDLAGARAAVIAAWLLALEPASIFFSTLLHKEALLLLSEGLVAYGGVKLWRRGSLGGLAPMAFGCLIALATRPYVGWFLVAAAAAITFHAALRLRARNEMASLALASVVVLLGGLSAPFIWSQATPDGLKRLQNSQAANTTDRSNLQLERVDYSTRADVVLNLPRRIRDLLLRPYPWQTANASQQMGVLGTLFALALLVLLAQALWSRRGHVMARAGPLIYVTSGQLVAYALSVGNAGTGFRYRTHLVALGICLLMALQQRRAEAPAAEEDRRMGPSEPVPVAQA